MSEPFIIRKKVLNFSSLPFEKKYLLLDSLRNLSIPYRMIWDKKDKNYKVEIQKVKYDTTRDRKMV